MLSAIQVSLDGGVTFINAPDGVKVIIYEASEDDDTLLDLHITIDSNCEGIITDLYPQVNEDCVGPLTACYPIDTLVGNCK